MRESAVDLLRCPRCHAERALRLMPTGVSRDEVREGTLSCEKCGHQAAVAHGIADLLYDPPAAVIREAAGLGRFAEVMLRDGWDRQRVLRLPQEPDPYWDGQRMAFDALQNAVDFAPEQRVLDVGSNTCWASAAFARRGLAVIALDIALHEMQGLRTADWWMERDDTHFERVLGTMFDIPLASGTLDHVFCCEVLHHNSLRTLVRTFREAHRVLKPGGVLSVIRETLRTPRRPQLHPGHEVADFEGNEHAFFASTYLLAARAAGFAVQVLDPAGHWVLSDTPLPREGKRRRARLKIRVLDAVRRRPRSRNAYRTYLHHIDGGVPLSFIARKA